MTEIPTTTAPISLPDPDWTDPLAEDFRDVIRMQRQALQQMIHDEHNPE